LVSADAKKTATNQQTKNKQTNKLRELAFAKDNDPKLGGEEFPSELKILSPIPKSWPNATAVGCKHATVKFDSIT